MHGYPLCEEWPGGRVTTHYYGEHTADRTAAAHTQGPAVRRPSARPLLLSGTQLRAGTTAAHRLAAAAADLDALKQPLKKSGEIKKYI